MGPEPTVRRIRADEWEAMRQVRLEALRTDPMAFGSTHGREAAFPPEVWQDRVRQGATSERRATFVADAAPGRLVGSATVIDEGEDFNVVGMWLAPAFRGRGLGGRLLDAAIAWVEASYPSARIVLDVNPSQEAAVRTYLARGFVFTAVEEPLGHDPPAVARQMVRAPARPGRSK